MEYLVINVVELFQYIKIVISNMLGFKNIYILYKTLAFFNWIMKEKKKFIINYYKKLNIVGITPEWNSQ